MSRDALEHAIAEQPEDRSVRLIYADWLEEQSDDPADLARAELIRVQIQLERLPPDPPADEVERLQTRERAILKSYAKTWSKPLGRLASKPVFRAGFIEHVQTGASRFARRGKKLLDALPTISSVYFREASNELDELLASNLLPRLRRVDLQSMCTCGFCPIQDEIRHLVQSPQMAGITHLNLSGNRLTLRDLQEMVKSPHLGSLRHLNLSYNPLSASGRVRLVRLLLEAPWLEQLEELVLLDVGLSRQAQELLENRLPGRVVVSAQS